MFHNQPGRPTAQHQHGWPNCARTLLRRAQRRPNTHNVPKSTPTRQRGVNKPSALFHLSEHLFSPLLGRMRAAPHVNTFMPNTQHPAISQPGPPPALLAATLAPVLIQYCA